MELRGGLTTDEKMEDPSATASREKAMKAVEAIFERYNKINTSSPTQTPLFDQHLMSIMQQNLASATSTPTSTSTFALVMDARYANINGVMHGGAAGVIFDMCTTTALAPIARAGFWDFLGGVTRSLNISYLKAIPIGTKILIHSEVQSAGKTMAMIRGKMTSEDGKVVYCTCEHHKVAVPTLARHLEYRVKWDDEMMKERKVGVKVKL